MEAKKSEKRSLKKTDSNDPKFKLGYNTLNYQFF